MPASAARVAGARGQPPRNTVNLRVMPGLPAVHPFQPRFAQGVTGVLCLEAILFDTPAAVAEIGRAHV